MLRFYLFIFAFLIGVSVFAGDYESTIQGNNNVFMYLYTPSCGYCNKFNPIYENLKKSYSSKCQFVKIDATTSRGQYYAKKFGGNYVPFVVLSKNHGNSMMQIPPSCLINYACANKATKSYIE
jgi:thiol-disulfide isomerase/thioredoxin